jgi:hypothetical protein
MTQLAGATIEDTDTVHEWLRCDVCGEVQLLAPRKAGRCCHLTPACAGHVRRVVLPFPA